MNRYRIRKSVSNNVVFAFDENGNEVVLAGKGIGFQKRHGDLAELEKIERIYRMENSSERNRMAELLKTLPQEDLEIADTIIRYAQSVLGTDLRENIFILLSDHISFAIQRFRNGISFSNAMLWEIQHFYEREFEIGLYGLQLIEERLGIHLPEDEAGFIAIHLVNARLHASLPVVETASKILKASMKIISMEYGMTLDESSLDYGRFVVHLKFCCERLLSGKPLAGEDEAFITMIQTAYPREYDVARRIALFIERQYSLILPESERLYLTVHIRRITADK